MSENELIPFTFQSTGKVVQIRKVSPFLQIEIQKAFPAPEPPVQEVDYGDGDVRMEKNFAHPDYVRALENYNLELSDKIQRLIIKRGVAVEITEEIRKEVEELRGFWLDEYGVELPEKNEKMIYVLDICIGTQEDGEELIAAITRRSQPTEVAIKQAEGTFQR